jgi:hypothetical protein
MGFVFSKDGNVVGTKTCQNFTWTNIFVFCALPKKLFALPTKARILCLDSL